MKKYIIPVLGILAIASCGPTYVTVQHSQEQPIEQQPAQDASYQTFYDELSPYGQWVDYPNYGYVWMPNVGPDFKPYSTNGHWVYSDDGWVWASNYNWGWATFHYGRWFFDQGYGWMWVPGNEWAPAWVSWRRNDDYYGWAPLSPGVNVGGGYSYNPPTNYWSFVPHRYVNTPNINNYYVNETKNVTIINNTTIINQTVVNNNTTVINNNGNAGNGNRGVAYRSGPDAGEVSRETGANVRPVTVVRSSRPGQTQLNNGQLNIFRPRINAPNINSTGQASNTGQVSAAPAQRPVPARVQSLNDVRMRNPNANQNNNSNNPPATAPANRPVENVQPTRPVNNEPNVSRPAAENNSPKPAAQNERPINAPVINNEPATRQVVTPANNNNPDPRRNPSASNPPSEAVKPAATPVTNNEPSQRPVLKPADANTGAGQRPVNANFARQNRPQPAAANPNSATGTRPAAQQNQQQNRLNANKPAPAQNQPVPQRRPVVKPPVVTDHDKPDKPKPATQQQ